MKDYNFTPVLNERRYNRAIEFVIIQAGKLVQKVLGIELPIDTVTLFTHQLNEYEFIEGILTKKGPVSPLSHGLTLYVEVDTELNGNQIKHLGVRQPDTTRSEVGYADFPVEDFEQLKNDNSVSMHVSEILSGNGQRLLELRHPDFDVRGYVYSSDS
jgi:hypothetical protein